VLLRAAKNRAKTKSLPFAMTEKDIVIPKVCPILGIELAVKRGRGPQDASPTLDRINNDLGYVKGNVRVISFRANSLRKDGTLEEFQKIVKDFLDRERTLE
jgi:hypothetical protein